MESPLDYQSAQDHPRGSATMFWCAYALGALASIPIEAKIESEISGYHRDSVAELLAFGALGAHTICAALIYALFFRRGRHTRRFTAWTGALVGIVSLLTQFILPRLLFS